MPVIRNNIVDTEHNVVFDYYESGGLVVLCTICDIVSDELATPVAIELINALAERHKKLALEDTSCSVPGHPEGRVNWVNGTFYCAGCESTHTMES